jgi:tRNA pseudouridine38-40 synthase
VQGDIEIALEQIFERPIKTDGAGRTDAGVHALGQVMSLADAPDDVDLLLLRNSLNSMCGPSISVTSVTEAAPDFHARFSARSRAYVYGVYIGEVPDPFLTNTSWHVRGELDVAAMNEAAGHLLGEHDFSSFGRVVDPKGTPVRNLVELRCRRDGDIVRVKARATAFIQQMVRSLVGTLVQVGAGKRGPGEMVEVLEARDRGAAGPVAPPHGLCLVSVEYDEGWSRPFDHYK